VADEDARQQHAGAAFGCFTLFWGGGCIIIWERDVWQIKIPGSSMQVRLSAALPCFGVVDASS
jgi:hypothetical protein